MGTVAAFCGTLGVTIVVQSGVVVAVVVRALPSDDDADDDDDDDDDDADDDADADADDNASEQWKVRIPFPPWFAFPPMLWFVDYEQSAFHPFDDSNFYNLHSRI